MNELFFQLFSFWTASSILKWLGVALGLFFLFFGWSKLWNKQWAVWQQKCLWICAMISSLPMVFVLNSKAAETILNKGSRIFVPRVERRLNVSMERFLISHATESNDGEVFIRTAIPVYAADLVAGSPFRYFPIEPLAEDALTNESKLQSLLWDVYVARQISENSLDAESFDYIHSVVVQYLSEQQFSQNKEKLQQWSDFSAWPLFSFFVATAMIVCARLAYLDIDKRYCYPYQ